MKATGLRFRDHCLYRPPNNLNSLLAYAHKHRHISDQGVPYEFQNAYQLLTDFFAEVDRVLEEIKKQ